MKAIRGGVLIKTYLHQKNTYTITGQNGEKIDLFIGSDLRENYRERNPVVAEIIDNSSEFTYLKKGDFIIVHHNMVAQPEANARCVEYDPQKGVAFFSLPGSGEVLLARVNKKTGKPEPICGNMLVERVFEKIQSSLIIIPEIYSNKKVATVMKIVKVSPEITDLYAGQKVAVHKFSDYEMVYSWNKKEYSSIKVNREMDVLDVIIN